MRKILLDTNAYVAYLKGDEQGLEALARAETVFMSVIVLGELQAGFMGGSRPGENLAYLERFLEKSSVKVLDATRETAAVFGDLKEKLKKAGTPLPINDVWIAAHALETGSLLITYDTHFRQITGLRKWPI